MSWTDDRVEKLKELWGEGLSASQIAKQLGGVTRNAVIGKVHRLGLSHRGATEPAAANSGSEAKAPEAKAAEPKAAATPKQPEAEAPKREPRAPAAPPPAAAPVETAEASRPNMPIVRDPTQPRPPGQPTPEEEAARVTLAEIEKKARKLDLLELTERTCKWPIGDPAEDGFFFCGLPSVPGKPYCEHHIEVAFQPMSTRRDRSRASR